MFRSVPARAVVVLAAAGILVGVPGSAQAAPGDPAASKLAVQGVLDPNGSLRVTETFTFPSAVKSLTQTLATRTEITRARQQVYSVSGLSATVGGKQANAQVNTGSDSSSITVTPNGSGPVVISYTVSGATSARGKDVLLEWPLVQGLDVAVSSITGSIKVPGSVTYVDCESGQPGSLSPCTSYGANTFESPDPSFTDGGRAAGDQVQMTIGLKNSGVAATQNIHQRWTLDRAFSAGLTPLLAALIPLLLGLAALWALHRRVGRDFSASGKVTPVAEFTPTGEGTSRFTVLDDVRPGEVGTVADERVDPIDVTATLLDLAVRGHLRIVELPRAGEHSALDWAFERTGGGQGELLGYERELLDAVAPAGGQQVRVSTIDSAVHPAIPTVQHELYDEVVRRGWFSRRPDAARNSWTGIGVAAVVVAVVVLALLVAFTTFGLLGLVLVALALLLLWVAQQMPRRTASGSALLGGLRALAGQLQVQPTDQAARGQEIDEASRVLPYATVLGGRERWLKAIADAGQGTVSWYQGPATWRISNLPESIEAFITTVQGRLYGR